MIEFWLRYYIELLENSIDLIKGQPTEFDNPKTATCKLCGFKAKSIEEQQNHLVIQHFKEKTSLEGKLLGTVKPIWVKVGKREQCLGWMETMHRRGLCVKKLEDYAK